jgi:glycosyltransferase involved in cell wall biosynthesis
VFSEPGSQHANSPESRLAREQFGAVEKDIVLSQIGSLARNVGFERMLLKPFVYPEFVELDYCDWDAFKVGRAPSAYATPDLVAQFLELNHSVFILQAPGARPLTSARPGRLSAHMEIEPLPVHLTRGQEIAIQATIENSGDTTWLAGFRKHGGYVTFGVKICQPDGKLLFDTLGRTPLAQDVAPGGKVSLQAQLALPETLPAGAYVMRFDMVDEQMVWFEQAGSTASLHAFTVGDGVEGVLFAPVLAQAPAATWQGFSKLHHGLVRAAAEATASLLPYQVADELLESVALAICSIGQSAPVGMLHGQVAPAKKGSAALVSVIMPCYNAAQYVGKAIDSVLTQSHSNLEVLVVDDGSTDGTASIVQGFDDPRIQYIYQDNSGPAAARNNAMAVARGEYIAFLDADDIALPDRLAEQVKLIEDHPEASVVTSGFTWIDEHDCELPWNNHSWRKLPDLNNLQNWLYDCPIVPSATMLRRSALLEAGGFDTTLHGGEDWNLWLRLVLKGHRMVWHSQVACLYRHRSDSLSNDAERMSRDCVKALSAVLQRPDFPKHLTKAGIEALAIRRIDGAKRLYTSGKWEQGRQSLEEAITLAPHLMAGQPSRIEDELVSAAVDPIVEDPVALINSVLRWLPSNAAALTARRKPINARVHLELLGYGLRQGKYGLVLKHWLPTLLQHPGWLLNRGMWGIAVRAVGNRVHSRQKPA